VWSNGLEVTGGGTGVVSHAGLGLLRRLADRTGPTGGLSRALIQTAKVTAGAILFGYVMMGLLDGYIVTTTLVPEQGRPVVLAHTMRS
jgi:hypothetical protein